MAAACANKDERKQTMRTKQEHASEKHTLLRLFQNLEPTTLARVLEDVEHWDPKWFFEAFQTIVEDGLWWYDDEDIDEFNEEVKTYRVGEEQ